jgi:hypothetical protein
MATAALSLDAIRAYRQAARTIARDESLGANRYLALVRLIDRAQAEIGDEWTRVAVRRVVWAESWELLTSGKTPAAPSSTADPVTRACHGLRAEGFERCPSCRRVLPSPDTLSRWERLNRRMLEEAFAAEAAAEPRLAEEAGR